VAIFHSDSAPIAAATAVVISAKDSSDIQQQQNGGGNRAAANQGVHNSRPAVVDFYDNQAQSSLAPLQQQMEGSGFTEVFAKWRITIIGIDHNLCILSGTHQQPWGRRNRWHSGHHNHHSTGG
jgi:hypothetical protein